MAVPPLASRSRQECLERDGFTILERVLTPDQVAELTDMTGSLSSTASAGMLERRGEIYGVRGLLWQVPAVRRLAQSRELLEIVATILGREAFAVRGLFFDKTLSTNWK